MKTLLCLFAACLLSIGCTTHSTAGLAKSSPDRRTAEPASIRPGTLHNIKTTAYCHQESGVRTNAIGKKLTAGPSYSASADWSRYPLGTVFRVAETGRIHIVDDYGPALVGTDTIDLFVPSKPEMNRWGVRRVRIDILQKGSYAESLQTLLPRSSSRGYVRKMVQSLKSKSQQQPINL